MTRDHTRHSRCVRSAEKRSVIRRSACTVAPKVDADPTARTADDGLRPVPPYASAAPPPPRHRAFMIGGGPRHES
nr:hypothetical protein [Thioalkalivibrio nitratireducens]